ncbi:MAG: outer membrane lipoprotein carrier protein LolA [Acidobacteriota bacterium]
MKHCRFAILGLFALLALLPTAAHSVDPWSALTTLRDGLREGGPTRASFVHHYVPAGFPEGEQENGDLALALPDCLRWDYQDPYPKSFLVCGDEAHFWVRDDSTGRRYRVDPEAEPGLDLLLLSVEQLATRYQATATSEGKLTVVELTPLSATVELASARFVVAEEGDRLLEVAYEDREGGKTRFEISGYQPLSEEGVFSPPATILWRDN